MVAKRFPDPAVLLSALWAPLALGAQATKRQPAQKKKSSVPTGSVADRVKHIIAEQLILEESKVLPSARFVEDLGADSLDLVELVMAWEEAFDIQIEDKDCAKIHTVQEAIDFIQARRKPAGKPGTKPNDKQAASHPLRNTKGGIFNRLFPD
jgi:acyl carrier protein